MQKRHKWMVTAIISCCMVLIVGCVEQRHLEKLGLITAAGYDLEKKNNLRGTVVVHKFDPMAQNMTKVISAVAKTSKGLRQEQNLESNQKLVSGQLRIVVYSKELAEKGIIQLVDTLNRDSTIGNMVYLTISEKSANAIMKMDNKDPSINLGTYLFNLIKQNVDGEQILSPTLQEFNHNYYESGKDPVLPILKIEKNDVNISGMALFKNDQLIDEIKRSDLFYLKILIDKYKAGTQEIGFNRDRLKKLLIKSGEIDKTKVYDKIFLSLDNIRSKSKIQLVDHEKLRFRVDVELDSRLLEATEPLEVGNPASIKMLEAEVNRAIKKNTEDLIAHLQKLGVDPVGFGNVYEAHTRGKPMTKEGWRKKYKEASFDVHVENTIVLTGVID